MLSSQKPLEHVIKSLEVDKFWGMVHVKLLQIAEDLWLYILHKFHIVPDLFEPRFQISPVTIATDEWAKIDEFDFEERRNRDSWVKRLGRVPKYPLDSSDLLPWEKRDRTFDEQLSGTIFEELREAAIKVLHGELNLHLFERKPRWLRNDVWDPEQPPSFQFVLGGGNLWQMIWELTGLDTAQLRSWRLCPACNVLFYPKRSDQYYCKSEEQVRASKRNYARIRRQRERLGKLFATARGYTEKQKRTEKAWRSAMK